jgi:hypothetical protein
VTPLHGALEASYRFYRDTFGTTSHTLGATWLQKIGERFVLSPSLRYYQQSAADFYRITLDGTSIVPGLRPNPAGPFYSADYRLAKLQTWDYAVKAVWKVSDAWQFDAAVEHYEMQGRDGFTLASAFPRAKMVTLGARCAGEEFAMIDSPNIAKSRPEAPPSGAPVEPLRRLVFQALGTRCEVQYAAADAARAAAFEHAAVAWVQRFEAKYSRFRPDSLVSRINTAAGRAWVEIDAEMEQMLDLCGSLHFMTGGVLDATALPLLRLWNYKAEQPRVPGDDEVAAARRLVGWSKGAARAGQGDSARTGHGARFRRLSARNGPWTSWRRLRASMGSRRRWSISATICARWAFRRAGRRGTWASKIRSAPARRAAASPSAAARAWPRRAIICGVSW